MSGLAELSEGPEHDVLLVAGSRSEAARLVPIAARVRERGRMAAVTVAAGLDPIRTHDAFEAFGRPSDITVLLGDPHSTVAAMAAMSTRVDDLLDSLDPSAVLICGGGSAALVTAHVAFWRRIPVVYLDAGADIDLSCPFPQEANRRVIGQLTSLFLRAGNRSTLAVPSGPHAIVVGDPMATTTPSDPSLAALAARARAGRCRVALLDPAVEALSAAAPLVLEAAEDLEVVFLGAPIEPRLLAHPRVCAVERFDLPDLVGALSVCSLGASHLPHRCREAVEFGVPALLVDAMAPGEIGPTSVPPEPAAAAKAILRMLDERPRAQVRRTDWAAARRVEQALAWMFGLREQPPGIAMAGGDQREVAPG
jgi:UDP-N-acetylglucosamine 2-epimerase (non-hydrolysing)